MSAAEPPRRVDVRLASTAELDADDLRRCEALLRPEERARADRLVVPGARLLYIAARGLLRTTLSRHAEVAPGDWRFVADANGKPHVAGAAEALDLRFNLSHTDGLVAVAVAHGCDVGTDVERIASDANVGTLADMVLTAAERAALAAAPAAEHGALFARFWTLKEAYLKARGSGLSEPPERIAFDLAPETPQPVFSAPDWSFRQMQPTPDHILALAIASSNVDVRVAWAAPGLTPRSGCPRPPAPAGTRLWRRAS